MSNEPILRIGRYGLHIIQYPSKRWGFVGTIPAILCVEKKGSFGEPYYASPSFETKEDAMKYFEEKKHLITT
jgi:hypothetical protein